MRTEWSLDFALGYADIIPASPQWARINARQDPIAAALIHLLGRWASSLATSATTASSCSGCNGMIMYSANPAS
jgi:hypothetical protein